MPSRLLLCCLFALSTDAVADAGDGQFMGYELGTEYPVLPQDVEVMTTGNLLIGAENPTKPADIAKVSLIVTPDSRTIGYIVAASWYATESEARQVGRRYVELLRAKYPDWDFGREMMDASSNTIIGITNNKFICASTNGTNETINSGSQMINCCTLTSRS